MSDKGKDKGVFNIVNMITGKKFTSGSTNMDQLMNKYTYDIEHGNHHNEELRKDIEEGDTFRFEVVSRDCKTEDEIRALRDAEIYRNRNNTYNKDVNIYFDGGNPNAEFPQGKKAEKLNNVEDFANSQKIVKIKEETKKQYKYKEPSTKNEKYLNKQDIRKLKNRTVIDFGAPKEKRKKIYYNDNIEKSASKPHKPKRRIERLVIDFGAPKRERKKIYYKDNIEKSASKPHNPFGAPKEERKKYKKNIVDFGKRNREKAKRLEEEQTKRKDIGKLKNRNVIDFGAPKGKRKIIYEHYKEDSYENDYKKYKEMNLISDSVIKKHLEWKNKRLKKEIEEIDMEISQLKRRIEDLEDKLDELENDKKQLKKEYLVMDEELYKTEYKKIFELEKSSLGEKSRHNRRLKQLERKRKRIIIEQL